MKKGLKQINLIITILILIIILILKWQYDNNSIEISLKTITIIGVTVNLFCIVSMYNIEKKLTSPYIMFQALSIPFLYGNLICREIFDFEVKEIFDLRVLVTSEMMIKACFLICYCQLGLHLGNILCKIVKRENIKEENNINEKMEIEALRRVGIVLLLISAVPAIYDFFENLKFANALGYNGLIVNKSYGLQSIFDKIIPFFQISLFILMVAYKDKKIYSKNILIFIIIFYGTQIFFGSRGIPLISVITGIWLYNKEIKQISKKVLILTIILIIPLSSVINIIRQVRDDYGIKEWIGNLDNLVQENLDDNNPILETLYEMGTAIYPTSYTIGVIPDKIPYKFGKTYFLSVYSIIAINMDSGSNNLAYDMNVAAQISGIAGAPFGGSYIQEAYANFGWLSPIFMICLGIFFEMLNRKIQNIQNYISIVLMAYFLNAVLWTVRNVMITLPRELVWYILPTYILYKLIYNSLKKKNRYESNSK